MGTGEWQSKIKILRHHQGNLLVMSRLFYIVVFGNLTTQILSTMFHLSSLFKSGGLAQ